MAKISHEYVEATPKSTLGRINNTILTICAYTMAKMYSTISWYNNIITNSNTTIRDFTADTPEYEKFTFGATKYNKIRGRKILTYFNHLFQAR